MADILRIIEQTPPLIRSFISHPFRSIWCPYRKYLFDMSRGGNYLLVGLTFRTDEKQCDVFVTI